MVQGCLWVDRLSSESLKGFPAECALAVRMDGWEGSTAVIISASLQPFGLSRLAEAFELSGIGPRGALRL